MNFAIIRKFLLENSKKIKDSKIDYKSNDQLLTNHIK